MVIDLTGTPPPRWLEQRRRSHRRWLVALACLAVAAGALAAVNYAAAVRWRGIAQAAEGRADAAAADAAAGQQAVADAELARDAAQQRRRALSEQLAVSEADAAALEARVISLASDRARAEDYGQAVAAAPPGTRIRALQAQVDSCTAQIEAVRVSLVAASDDASWQRALTAAEATCEQLGADLDALTGGR